ncbi:MAG: hypothetical protein EXR50_05415 [Dehalococcoidia bacterium]|nr:hypothetical protein [Dehalococcoidia bacterium]
MDAEQKTVGEQIEVDAFECQHHWVLEAPAGPLSSGFCKKCGKVRKFPNSAESVSWEESKHIADKIEPNELPVNIGSEAPLDR